MIYHLMYGDATFHIPRMCKIILQDSVLEHFFIIWCTNRDYVGIYEDLFSALNHQLYQLVIVGDTSYIPLADKQPHKYSSREKFRTRILQPLRLCAELWKYRSHGLIIHGFCQLPAIIFCLLFFKAVAMIAWIRPSDRGAVRKKIRSMIYGKFKYIFCLQESDLNFLQSSYRLSNCAYLPYVPDLEIQLNHSLNYGKHNILLGNSLMYDRYKEVLLALNKMELPADTSVTCMVVYGGKDGDLDGLKAIAGKLHYKIDFWHENVSLEKYVERMGEASVVILPPKVQSALGALYSALTLGKKVYLDGTNLDWAIESGFKVFPLKEILDINTGDIFADFSMQDAQNNRLNFLRILGPEAITARRERLFQDFSRCAEC